MANMTDKAKQLQPTEEGSVQQHAATEDLRARVWELHLRGATKRRIAEVVGVHRQTVGRWLAAGYAELEADRKARQKRLLVAAVARMRRVQEQAWDDHDADDAREQAVLDAALFGTAQRGRSAALSVAATSEGNDERGGGGVQGIRLQSQRAQYLRVVLDAEKEIARLEGLYEATGDEGAAVSFVVLRDDGGIHGSRLTASVGLLRGKRGAGSSGDGADGGGESDDGE
ncbi:MAG: hypothetical protein OJF49_000288 [Ktedonobacterales bacterium]|jgi:hypothetical protein|nr:MAG: hypothetical protein OJF49_000288 [Ktedonobacterales bacterium]